MNLYRHWLAARPGQASGLSLGPVTPSGQPSEKQLATTSVGGVCRFETIQERNWWTG
jgi:hypothetical protein